MTKEPRLPAGRSPLGPAPAPVGLSRLSASGASRIIHIFLIRDFHARSARKQLHTDDINELKSYNQNKDMNIKISELEKILTKAAQHFILLDEAKYFAKQQIDTHLKKSPRTNPLKEAVDDMEAWINNSNNKVEIQVDKKGSLLLNFNKLGPSLKLKYIHDELEKRAKKFGISMVGVNNSHGFHTLNLWADGLGKRDLTAISFFNGGPEGVVPFGGTKGIFGTNPLSYSIPTQSELLSEN